MPPGPTRAQRKAFLEKDFYDAYRWLLEGAVAWFAAVSGSERCRHQRAMAMFASLVQARALYEFYFEDKARSDDARFTHFTKEFKPSSRFYGKYMAGGRPANKRVFHLVYGRENHSGGFGHDGPDHLKNQVMAFANDLHQIGSEFVEAVDDPGLRRAARQALIRATEEVAWPPASYRVDPNPLG